MPEPFPSPVGVKETAFFENNCLKVVWMRIFVSCIEELTELVDIQSAASRLKHLPVDSRSRDPLLVVCGV